MEPFKNEFSVANACRIAAAVGRARSQFDQRQFLKGLGPALGALELKDRMRLVADRLHAALELEPPELFDVLLDALARDEADAAGLRGFQVWPLTELVARHGLPHFNASMQALAQMTRRFTAEFAIRPFIREQRQRTLKQMLRWAGSRDEHLRRLASEGSRPLLPWGERLPEMVADPELTWPILDKLRHDPSGYVRRSVANHLNDHSKGHPEWVIERLGVWRLERPDSVDLRRLIRHACRTLLKLGHAGALELNGFPSASAVRLVRFKLGRDRVVEGGALEFEVGLKNEGPTSVRVMLDYAVHYLKATGARSPKVFKGRVLELEPGETWQARLSHSFRPVTTRRLYPGQHLIAVMLNGREAGACVFDCTVAPTKAG